MFTLLRDQTLKELTVHGNKTFPYEIYFGGVSMWENGCMDWHWHDQFEINLVTSGTLTYFIENERFFLQEGEAVFVNAGRLHHSYSQDQAQYSHTIVFGSELFCEDNSCEWYHCAIQPLIESTRNGIHLTKKHRWMQSVLSHLRALYAKYEQHPFGYEVDIKGHLCLIFAEILQNTSHSQQPTQLETEKMKRMRKILSYISQNYQNNFSLSDLSSEVNLSESECSRFFSQQMQKPLFAFINQYRIERSCEMLSNTDLPVSEIATRTGFNSFSYYSRKFREFLHCTPSEYRQKIQAALDTDKPRRW